MKSVVIVQARANSKRFPRKVLADLCGQPVLWHVLTRCKKIKGKDMVVLAVPDEADSDELEQIARNLKVRVVRDPENDVLERYVIAARRVRADYVMRITADCPLIDPDVCSRVLDTAKQPGVDYVSNVMPRTFEWGLDCEAFTRWALELTAKRATEAYDREHTTSFIQRAPIFHKINVESDNPDRALTNLCIDTPEDLIRIRKYVSEKYGRDFAKVE